MFGLNCIVTVSLLNLTEEERSKPENWIPVGWIPFYSNELSKRPSSGWEWFCKISQVDAWLFEKLSGGLGCKDTAHGKHCVRRWCLSSDASFLGWAPLWPAGMYIVHIWYILHIWHILHIGHIWHMKCFHMRTSPCMSSLHCNQRGVAIHCSFSQ